jgi:hypothetical protein
MFQAFPLIFENGHHFNVQTTGLSFLGIGVGMVAGLATQPFWNRSVVNQRFQLQPECGVNARDRLSVRTAARHGGKAPPETLLIMGQVGGILVPICAWALALVLNNSNLKRASN